MFVEKIVRYHFQIAVISIEKSFGPCKSEQFYRKFDVNHPEAPCGEVLVHTSMFYFVLLIFPKETKNFILYHWYYILRDINI